MTINSPELAKVWVYNVRYLTWTMMVASNGFIKKLFGDTWRWNSNNCHTNTVSDLLVEVRKKFVEVRSLQLVILIYQQLLYSSPMVVVWIRRQNWILSVRVGNRRAADTRTLSTRICSRNPEFSMRSPFSIDSDVIQFIVSIPNWFKSPVQTLIR